MNDKDDKDDWEQSIEDAIEDWDKFFQTPFAEEKFFQVLQEFIVGLSKRLAKPSGRGTVKPSSSFPSLFQENGKIFIVTDIPGVEKVKLEVSNDKKNMTVHAVGADRNYQFTVDLPERINPSSGKILYKNGVLTLQFNTVRK